MIIVGNSNVDCFNRLGFLMDAGGEKVKISWVGALVVQHFFQSIPIGEKVRSLFAAEEGWKFLSIGTHDVYELWLAASKGMLAEAFAMMVRRYEFVFQEFASSGKFGWIVFAQPLHEVTFPNLEDKRRLEIVRTFQRRISKLCIDNNIAIVDPLDRILGTDGLPLNQYLQIDRLHMNQEGAALYAKEISMVIGTDISFQPKEALFEPQSEAESFCSLLLNNLNLEAERAISGDELQTALAEFVTERLRQKGLDLNIDADTELVDSGLLDSLDLVETYTFATSAMRMDVPFDVNLRDLNTIQKISEYLIGKEDGGTPSVDASKPVQTDFWLSLRGDFNDPDERTRILEAENHISLLDDRTFVTFREGITVALAGNICNYGIVPFWIALNQARRGHYQDALMLLDYCSDPKLRFPFSDPRVQFYREKWKTRSGGQDGAIPAQFPPKNAEEPKISVQIWERPVDESVISFVAGHRATSGGKRRPRFSVITPSFNQARYIEQNIRSVLDQNYEEFEHIVIDGGSSDDTVSILKRYPHLKWISEKDGGQSDALNKGFAMAQGDIICWLNSDDWLAPGAFDRIALELESGQKSVIMGKCLLTDSTGKPFQEVTNPERSFYHLFKYWVPYSIPCQPSIFFLRDLLESVRRPDGTYVDPTLHNAMDHDLWARMMKTARFYSIDQVLSFYRHHEESKTITNGDVFAKDWSAVFKRYTLKNTRSIGVAADPQDPERSQRLMSALGAALPYSVVDLGTDLRSEALAGEGSPEWIILPGEPVETVPPEAFAEAVRLLTWTESLGCVKVTQWNSNGFQESSSRLGLPSYVFRRFALEELTAVGLLGARGEEIAEVLAKKDWKTIELRSPCRVTLGAHVECNPLISVVITCYNYGRYLRECVQSALSQSLRSYELIIVNDGSTDDSQEIAESLVKQFPSKAIKIVRQPNSGKPAVARNNGISQAMGKYILCLDADDKISPGFLLECARTLESNPGVSIAYPDQQNFGDATGFEPHPEYDFTTLTRFNYICLPAVFPKKAWEIIGGFSTDVGYEDWDFWISCGERGFYGKRVPGAVLWYRKHSSGQYSRDRAVDQKIKAQIVLNHAALYRPSQIRWAVGVLREDPSALAIDGGMGVIPAVAESEPVQATRAVVPSLTDRDAISHNILLIMFGWKDEGGGTMFPRQIAKGLAATGHTVSVIYAAVEPGKAQSGCYIDERMEDGVRLFAVYNRPVTFCDPQNPEREIDCPEVRDLIVKTVSRIQPDIIHYHNLVSLSMGVAGALSLTGIPTIYTSHNYWALCPRLYLFKENLSLCGGPSSDGSNCASCVGAIKKNSAFALRAQEGRKMLGSIISRHLAVSNRMREIFVANGHDGSRIRVLTQAPETADRIWNEIGSKRKPLSSNGPIKIGFIGSVYPQKGVHVLVQALQQFGQDQVECHIHGGGAGTYVEGLHTLDQKRLAKFHGGYDPAMLPSILAKLDLVVVPSVWEDCAPLVVAEALAARIPVVGSRIGGIPDFIRDGINGLLAESGDPKSLGAALDRFVQDRSFLARMQQNIARPRGFAEYLADLVKNYEELIVEPHKSHATNISGASSNEAVMVRPAPTFEVPRIRQRFSLFHTEGRGETIKKWISPYADIFRGCSNVLDVGCGPGIFLEAMTERGIPCSGYDYDTEMVEACRQRGLNASIADARSLENIGDYDGIHLGHVIEHMDGNAALKLLTQCANALRPAGLLLIRTPNWANATVRRGGFWLDLTHIRPYPLELLERILIDLGFDIVAKGAEKQGWNDIYILGRKKEIKDIQLVGTSDKTSGQRGKALVIWEGSQFVHHSLALINRELCLQLIDRGYSLSIIPYEKHEFGAEADPRFPELARRFNNAISFNGLGGVHIRHQWPPNFTPPSSGHWVIIQPWEFGSIPCDWVEPMSTLVDEIWVPSRHVLKSYVSSGVPADRVRVIPNGVNTRLFHPGALPCSLPTRKKFKFIFVGGTLWRKGVDLLLEAYCATFRREDDVTLIIKDMGADSFYQGQGARQTIHRIQKDPLAPEIIYSSEKLEEAEMPRLLTATDCLVHPYRGEGFGLPVLEAMACGVPVITTEGGSTDDFCSKHQAFLIPSNRREINHRDFELAGGAGWVLEPDLNALKTLMREAFEKADEAKQRALTVSEHIRRHYDWAVIGEKVMERLEQLVRQPVRRETY